jgi:hypothetical protein
MTDGIALLLIPQPTTLSTTQSINQSTRCCIWFQDQRSRVTISPHRHPTAPTVTAITTTTTNPIVWATLWLVLLRWHRAWFDHWRSRYNLRVATSPLGLTVARLVLVLVPVCIASHRRAMGSASLHGGVDGIGDGDRRTACIYHFGESGTSTTLNVSAEPLVRVDRSDHWHLVHCHCSGWSCCSVV